MSRCRMDSPGTRFGPAGDAAQPTHSIRYGTPPRRPYLQFPPPPPYPPPDEQEERLDDSDDGILPPPYRIQEFRSRRQDSRQDSATSSSLPSRLLRPSSKVTEGNYSGHLESVFPHESHFHQTANQLDQVSDVSRINNPCFRTPLDNLELERNENNRLNNIVCPRVEPESAEYSYAYYEPGPPTSHASFLVSNSNVNPRTDRNSRHTYLTRYGTEENIYEEISEVAAKCSQLAEQERLHHCHHRQQQEHPKQNHQSQVSLNQSILEEEVRRVQSRHRRVLGELNLTVEAMLMPPPPSRDEENMNNSATSSSKRSGTPDLLEDLLFSVGPTDELLSPTSCSIGGDLDSGFSGSSGTSYGFSGSSSASYNASVLSASSLRRRGGEKGSRTSQNFPQTVGANVAASEMPSAGYSPLLNCRAGKVGGACLKFNKVRDFAGCKAQLQNKQNQLQQQEQQQHGLFGRKGWIRLPGFNSSHTNKGKVNACVYVHLCVSIRQESKVMWYKWLCICWQCWQLYETEHSVLISYT